MEDKEQLDSFSIGSAASGVNIKVYFDVLDKDTAVKKINNAINLWKSATMKSGRIK